MASQYNFHISFHLSFFQLTNEVAERQISTKVRQYFIYSFFSNVLQLLKTKIFSLIMRFHKIKYIYRNLDNFLTWCRHEYSGFNCCSMTTYILDISAILIYLTVRSVFVQPAFVQSLSSNPFHPILLG